MNNVVMRRIVLMSEYRPLSSKRGEVASVEISVPPGNSGDVFFLGDDGLDVLWTRGEWHQFIRVELDKIMARGVPGDIVTVVGGTW